MPRLKPEDPLVQLTVKFPKSQMDAIRVRSRAWHIDCASIIRRGMEDALKLWDQAELNETEAMAELRQLTERTASILAMLNMICGAEKKDPAWVAEFERIKAVIKAAGSQG